MVSGHARDSTFKIRKRQIEIRIKDKEEIESNHKCGEQC